MRPAAALPQLLSVLLLLLACMRQAGGAPAEATGAPSSSPGGQGPAPAPGPAADGCPFTLRVGGHLIPVAQAPKQARFIVACKSMEQREQLAKLVAATRGGTVGGATAPALLPLTQTMPLLVGNLSRGDLVWMCQDPEASACVDYIERDEQVSLF